MRAWNVCKRSIADIRCGRHIRVVTDFIAFDLIPVLAIFWIVVGGLGVAMVGAMSIHVLVLDKPIRSEDTGELVPKGEAAKLLAMLGSGGAFFVGLGFLFLELVEQEASNAELILSVFGSLCLLGGILALILIWRGLRQPASK